MSVFGTMGGFVRVSPASLIMYSKKKKFSLKRNSTRLLFARSLFYRPIFTAFCSCDPRNFPGNFYRLTRVFPVARRRRGGGAKLRKYDYHKIIIKNSRARINNDGG